ncbi:TPM domain-containing protein [Bacillus sp. YC2]|uniref:TPM domain-containing protein n=1 Tax=Bacillus sp. YC2 TaxID=2861287 RepID=UPI001CA66801|nr:TPM domain-containing protein [Bacillus sp. YC2]MBY8914185.1 TPM domain-containing protein [Bacillus sp. YC2]
MRAFIGKAFLVCFVLLLLFPFAVHTSAEASGQKQYVYDNANLLTKEEIGKLEALAGKLGAKRKTDFIILTVNGTDGKDIAQYAGDFYDSHFHGSTAMLTIDMKGREVFISGYQKAEKYLDSSRLNTIRNTISSDISAGHYDKAFQTYMKMSYKDMGKSPGDQSDNLLFKWWFQLIAAAAVAGIAVTVMVYNSGGKVTVTGSTYMNHDTSEVLDQHDTYIRTTVTRERKPSDKDNDSDGGVTRGGTSYSGSKGSF